MAGGRCREGESQGHECAGGGAGERQTTTRDGDDGDDECCGEHALEKGFILVVIIIVIVVAVVVGVVAIDADGDGVCVAAPLRWQRAHGKESCRARKRPK